MIVARVYVVFIIEQTYVHALCSGVYALVTNIYKTIEFNMLRFDIMGKENKNEI